MDKNARINEIDIAKGIGIVLVMIGHTLPPDNPVRMFIYTFHMPLFFILVGMVMKAPNEKQNVVADFWEEKKLIKSYFGYSILFVLFDAAVRFGIHREMGMNDLFWDVYQTVVFYGINVLWFLATLILTKVLVKWICRIPVKGIFWFIIGAVCYTAVSIFSGKIGWLNAGRNRLFYFPLTALLRALAMIVYVLFGYITGRKIKEYLKRKNIRAAACAAVVTALLLFMLFHFAGEIDIHVIKMGSWYIAFVCAVLGTIMTLAVSMLLDKIKGIGALFRYMGIHSLFIMATHNYFEISQVINWLLQKLNLLSWRYVRLLQIFLLCVVECILCKICFFCAERVKILIRQKSVGLRIGNRWNNMEQIGKG